MFLTDRDESSLRLVEKSHYHRNTSGPFTTVPLIRISTLRRINDRYYHQFRYLRFATNGQKLFIGLQNSCEIQRKSVPKYTDTYCGCRRILQHKRLHLSLKRFFDFENPQTSFAGASFQLLQAQGKLEHFPIIFANKLILIYFIRTALNYTTVKTQL